MKNSLFLALLVLLGGVASTRGAALLYEDFPYADGALTNVAGGKWTLHGGSATTRGLNVTNQSLIIDAALFDDANSPLASGPFPAASGTNIYFSFICTVLSTTNASYIAHIKDNSIGFRARVFAVTNGAAPGTFRFGISNGGATPTNLPVDLTFSTPIRVVVKYVSATAQSTLWVNPSAESDTGITDTSAATGLTATSFAFRQNAGGGKVTVDNLIVATTFAEANTVGAFPPFITAQPGNQTIGEGANATFTVAASGSFPLSYQWLHADTNLPPATNATLTVTNVTTADAGNYQVIITNAAGSVTSQVAVLNVSVVITPPQIVTDLPASTNVISGDSVNLFVTASGTAPLSYQWKYFGTNISVTTSNLSLTGVTTNRNGPYQVIVTNLGGAATSGVVNLTVVAPPTTITNIAYLHTLQDGVNYALTNTAGYFTVDGIVTTHADLTGLPNALFYIQDATAGIAVFWANNGASLPRAGDLVRVTAKLSQFNGLLELGTSAADPNMSVSVLSSSNALPAATSLTFAWGNDPALAEPNESLYVVASNVFLTDVSGTFASTTYTLTNAAGESFALFVNAQTDIIGQPKLPGPITIFGVLGQFDSSSPFTTGYQLIPTRFADVLSASKAPSVRFTNVLSNLVRPGDAPTNTFAEHALRPGEKLTMTAKVFDPDGLSITIVAVSNNLPPTAQWTYGATSGTNLDVAFVFQPAPGDAGSNYVVTLQAYNSFTTNNATWRIYVPTAAEQQVLISEFLANPTSDPTLPHFNPLKRNPVLAANFSINDEYIEIANLSGTDIELINWSVADGVQVRHNFYDFATLGKSNAIVVYGGPLLDFAPLIGVPAFPASEGTTGLALNNTGTESIVVRNAQSNLVVRVVYTGADISGAGSVARFPNENGPFIPQVWISTNTVSPGTQYGGRLFSELPAPVTAVTNTALAKPSGSSFQFDWSATVGGVYSIWSADDLTQKFRVISGGVATNTAGSFTDTNAVAPARFYFISTQ